MDSAFFKPSCNSLCLGIICAEKGLAIENTIEGAKVIV
jgi:hypothetical protein